MFSTCSGLGDVRLNADARVLEMLAAPLVLRYPRLKSLSAESPLVCRLEAPVVDEDGDTTELLALANALQACAREPVVSSASSRRPSARP